MYYPNARLVKYSDSYLSLKYPEYMKAEKSEVGLDYLFWRKSKDILLDDESLSVRLMGNALPELELSLQMLRLRLLNPESLDYPKSRSTPLRCGETILLKNAIECVVESVVKETGERSYYWMLLFPADSGHVHVTIGSFGNFAEDEPRWIEVIQSIVIHRTDPIPGSHTISGPNLPKPKPPTELTTNLRSALKSLPEELQYLTDACLEMVEYDSDELEDYDFPLLDNSLREAIDGLSRVDAIDLLARHRDLLKEWLEERDVERNVYLFPVSIVVYTLMRPRSLYVNISET